MKRRLFVLLPVGSIGVVSWIYGSNSDAAAPVVRTAPGQLSLHRTSAR